MIYSSLCFGLVTQAMGIESEEDVNKMADFFITYPQQQEERAVVRRDEGGVYK